MKIAREFGASLVTQIHVLTMDCIFFADHFGVSYTGECVLLGSAAGAQEAQSMAVVVRWLGLPLRLFLWDCAQRILACTVAGYLHPVGHRRSSSKWLYLNSRTGSPSTPHSVSFRSAHLLASSRRVSGSKKELWVLSEALGIDCCGPVPFFADLWGDSSALYYPLLRLDRQHEMVRSSKYDRGVVPDHLHSGDLHHHVSHKSQVPERQVCVHAFRQVAGQWDQQRVACSALRAPVCPVHSHRLRGRFPCGRGGENCGHGWPPCHDPQCVCHCQHRVCAASGPHFLHPKP